MIKNIKKNIKRQTYTDMDNITDENLSKSQLQMKYLCLAINSTGLDVKTDHVIGIDYTIFDIVNGKPSLLPSVNLIVKPMCDYEIAPDAQASHHITKELVETIGIPFNEAIDMLQKAMLSCDALITYNGNQFDIPMLFNDCKLIGKELKLPHKVYDSFKIELAMNGMTLASVFKRLTGKTADECFTTNTKVNSIIKVFENQLNNTDNIDNVSEEFISPENMLIRDSNGHLKFKAGKWKGYYTHDVMIQDNGYMVWLFNSDVSNMFKEAIIKDFNAYRLNMQA